MEHGVKPPMRFSVGEIYTTTYAIAERASSFNPLRFALFGLPPPQDTQRDRPWFLECARVFSQSSVVLCWFLRPTVTCTRSSRSRDNTPGASSSTTQREALRAFFTLLGVFSLKCEGRHLCAMFVAAKFFCVCGAQEHLRIYRMEKPIPVPFSGVRCSMPVCLHIKQSPSAPRPPPSPDLYLPVPYALTGPGKNTQ